MNSGRFLARDATASYPPNAAFGSFVTRAVVVLAVVVRAVVAWAPYPEGAAERPLVTFIAFASNRPGGVYWYVDAIPAVARLGIFQLRGDWTMFAHSSFP